LAVAAKVVSWFFVVSYSCTTLRRRCLSIRHDGGASCNYVGIPRRFCLTAPAATSASKQEHWLFHVKRFDDFDDSNRKADHLFLKDSWFIYVTQTSTINNRYSTIINEISVSVHRASIQPSASPVSNG